MRGGDQGRRGSGVFAAATTSASDAALLLPESVLAGDGERKGSSGDAGRICESSERKGSSCGALADPRRLRLNTLAAPTMGDAASVDKGGTTAGLRRTRAAIIAAIAAV